MGALDDAERVHPGSVVAWRSWLAAQHDAPRGVWVVTWRVGSGRSDMSYDELVTAALAYGWVDSITRKLDDERTMLYVAPRKRGSGWSRPNKERIARLEAEGGLAPPGQAVVAAARADGSWSMLDDVENLVVPPDLAAAFDAVPGSREQWDSFPRSARRGILEWLVQAKRPDTRARRVRETAELAGRGERANQWRGPRGT